MMGVWNARLLDDSLHKALYGRGKALYQSTHHYKDFGLLGGIFHHQQKTAPEAEFMHPPRMKEPAGTQSAGGLCHAKNQIAGGNQP